MSQVSEKIAIVDSLFTITAMSWSVLTAARAAQAGKSLVECQRIAENARDNSGVLLEVDTLEFLRRGGESAGHKPCWGQH